MSTSSARATFAIRKAEPADYDTVVQLWDECGLQPKTTGRDSRTAFARQLRAFAGLYLVAEADRRVVGVVIGSHDLRKGWINRLAVSPKCRRRGIGFALAQACDAALRAGGIEIVAALVEPDNEDSTRLFRRLGYLADVPVAYFRKLDHPGA